jgi:ATP-dependent Clp protease ATP-binding subunit ClpX
MSAEHPKAPPVMLKDIRCSFCGKPGQRGRVVCGPTPDIAICDECVELCAEIIAEQTGQDPPPAA